MSLINLFLQIFVDFFGGFKKKQTNPHTMVIFQVMSLFANHKNCSYSLKHVFILAFKKEKQKKQTSNSLLLYSDHCDRLTNQNSFVKKTNEMQLLVRIF